MKKCQYCNTLNSENAERCEACGKPLQNSGAVSDQGNNYIAARKRPNKTTVVLTIAVLAVIAAMLGLFLRRPAGDTPRPNETDAIPTAAAAPEETQAPVETAEPSPTMESTPEPTPEPTPEICPSSYDLSAIGDDIVYPEENSYLASYETMYVRSEKGHSIYVFWDSSGNMEHRRNRSLYEGDQVTVLARQDGYSCVIACNDSGEQFSGWVASSLLGYE